MLDHDNFKSAFKATTNEMDYVKVQAWCEEKFGEFNVEWYRLGRDPINDLIMVDNGLSPSPDVYYFRTEQQQLLFGLKWA